MMTVVEGKVRSFGEWSDGVRKNFPNRMTREVEVEMERAWHRVHASPLAEDDAWQVELDAAKKARAAAWDATAAELAKEPGCNTHPLEACRITEELAVEFLRWLAYAAERGGHS